MFGYISLEGSGAADTLLAEAAARLAEDGLRVAGTIQINHGRARDGRCHMDIRVVPSGEVIRISEDLGPHSRGCRLDAGALERAVGLAGAGIMAPEPPHLVVINKFGKQEVDGRGFRPLIGQALERDIPVLTVVNSGQVRGFLQFADGLAEAVSPSVEAMVAWARKRTTAKSPIL